MKPNEIKIGAPYVLNTQPRNAEKELEQILEKRMPFNKILERLAAPIEKICIKKDKRTSTYFDCGYYHLSPLDSYNGQQIQRGLGLISTKRFLISFNEITGMYQAEIENYHAKLQEKLRLSNLVRETYIMLKGLKVLTSTVDDKEIMERPIISNTRLSYEIITEVLDMHPNTEALQSFYELTNS